MLTGQILAVILYTACLTTLSEQAGLTCDGGDMPKFSEDDVRVVDGYQRSGAGDLILLGRDQSLTVIDGDKVITGYLGVCYKTADLGCYKSGDDVEDCDNYIRGVTTLAGTCDSSSCRVLVCGTNAKLPRCAFCNYDGSMLSCSFIENDPPQDLPYIPAVDAGYNSCTADNIDGQGVFQTRKNHNATFLYHEGRLYYGLVREASSTKSTIGLSSVTPEGLITGKVITRIDSEKMVANEAHFVGKSFVSGDFVYFLFREPAQEFASLSAGQDHPINTYYSRIARICKNDAGADVSSTQILTSFLKQRLVCSRYESDGSSLEYNEIQDFALSDDRTTIHAIFTSGQNAAPQSALCIFDLASIKKTFNEGYFFGADGGTNNDLWRVYDGPAVLPRPGLDCSNPNTAATNFERDYNLMSDPANGTVQFFLVGDRFSNLDMTSESGTEIYIISSEKGCLYKVEVDTTEPDLGDPCQDPVVSRPIKDLELAPDNGYLVTTLDNVYVLSNCNVNQEPSVFPPGGTYRVPPNSTFELLYDTLVNGPPCIMSEGVEINECNNETAYRLLKNVSLDCTGNLVYLRILILDDTTVTFTESNQEYTILPYDYYTDYEIELRIVEGFNCTDRDPMSTSPTMIPSIGPTTIVLPVLETNNPTQSTRETTTVHAVSETNNPTQSTRDLVTTNIYSTFSSETSTQSENCSCIQMTECPSSNIKSKGVQTGLIVVVVALLLYAVAITLLLIQLRRKVPTRIEENGPDPYMELKPRPEADTTYQELAITSTASSKIPGERRLPSSYLMYENQNVANFANKIKEGADYEDVLTPN